MLKKTLLISNKYIQKNNISRFHAHTCKVVRTKCQAVPSIPPWQWATAKRDLMHCMFLAVSWKKKDMQDETRIIIILFFCIYLLLIRSVFSHHLTGMCMKTTYIHVSSYIHPGKSLVFGLVGYMNWTFYCRSTHKMMTN
jgi:hypothetical protein